MCLSLKGGVSVLVCFDLVEFRAGLRNEECGFRLYIVIWIWLNGSFSFVIYIWRVWGRWFIFLVLLSFVKWVENS